VVIDIFSRYVVAWMVAPAEPTGTISAVVADGDNENGDLARASFADLPLDAAERDRLLALRAATSKNAGAYVAVLTVLVEARHTYRLQLRTSEIRSRLAANRHLGLDDVTLRQALDQLREWGCVQARWMVGFPQVDSGLARDSRLQNRTARTSGT
jgi:hypothetical protein